MTEDEFVTMLVDTYKINKDDIPTIYATNLMLFTESL